MEKNCHISNHMYEIKGNYGKKLSVVFGFDFLYDF